MFPIRRSSEVAWFPPPCTVIYPLYYSVTLSVVVTHVTSIFGHYNSWLHILTPSQHLFLGTVAFCNAIWWEIDPENLLIELWIVILVESTVKWMTPCSEPNVVDLLAGPSVLDQIWTLSHYTLAMCMFSSRPCRVPNARLARSHPYTHQGGHAPPQFCGLVQEGCQILPKCSTDGDAHIIATKPLCTE